MLLGSDELPNRVVIFVQAVLQFPVAQAGLMVEISIVDSNNTRLVVFHGMGMFIVAEKRARDAVVDRYG